MSEAPGFNSRYGVPNNNIVIIPTVLFSKNSVMPLKPVNPSVPQGTEEKIPCDKIVKNTNTILPQTNAPLMEHQQIQPAIENPTPAKDQLESKLVDQSKTQNIPELLIKEDVNKNVTNVKKLNKSKKVTSWASNYLQSIGHNNIKPIKINLSTRNKIQRIETISTKNNESKISLSNQLQEDSSSHEIFKMTDNHLSFSESNENIIVEHNNVGNIKTLHPVAVNTNETPDVHIDIAPISSRCNQNITSNSVNSNIMFDTKYTNNEALAHATALTGNCEATYCYSDTNHKIDILDAIKFKINHEFAMEQKSRVMNLPTHKDMCEDFIKEISNNKPTVSGKKYNRTKPSSPKKHKELERKIKKKYATTKNETKIKTLVKKEKNKILNKEALKNLKHNTSYKDIIKSKHVSMEIDKPKKEENKINPDLHLKKKQNRKPIIDLNDFESLTFNKKSEKQLITQSKSPERQQLKRVRTNSDDLLNSSSEIRTHSPIKSVVLVAENHHSNSPKRQLLDESFDLRSKLSRVNERIYKKQMDNDINKLTKQRDNLKITVENQPCEKIKSPKRSGVLKYKTKKCKKLKLVINVICQGSDDETTSSDSNYSETDNPTHSMDLSFLDDINVDEIVASLKHSPKHNMNSPLPYDSKTEEDIEISDKPKRQLATLLNMLQVKSETTKIKTSTTTDCKIEETMDSSTKSNVDNSNITHMKKQNMDKDDDESKLHSIRNTNTTHALGKILSQTNLQLQQQNTTSIGEGDLKPNGDIQTKEIDVGAINKEHESQIEGDRLILNESVILNEQEIIMIDLTDETEDMINTNNSTIFATSDLPSEKQCNEGAQDYLNKESKNNSEHNSDYDPENSQKDINDNQLKPITTLRQKENSKSATTSNKMDDKTEMDIMHKVNKSMDLTNCTEVDEIKSNLSTIETTVVTNTKNIISTAKTNKYSIKADEQQNVNTQIDIASEIIKQNINSPIKKVDELAQVENQIQEHSPETEEKELKENEESSITNNDKEKVIKSKIIKETLNTIPGDNDTKEICKEFNTIAVKEKPKDAVENLIETNKGSDMATKDATPKNNKDMCKVLESKAAIKIVNTIVENVWKTKNEHENVSQTYDETKAETEHLSKITNENTTKSKNTLKTNVTGKKIHNESTDQHRALAVLLEERMLDYIKKEIKIIEHIRLGKFSNIYSCKDSSGQMYAAKVLTNQNNRHALGIQKELMIKQLQKDIPKENLNIIYLFDGFGVERYWCFLTEYYPKNLQQALEQRNKPFHIKLVQHLARQLISAVMVLRNNEIVHSDIKPTHILLNSSHDRLKLCGFDGAYYINNVNLLPNIGTVDYRAPEIIIGFSADYSIDVWSSALVIYQMATNKKLFSGIFNNDILFKQMCTFGNLPRDMIEMSLYQNNHFRGRSFMRRVGFNGQDTIFCQKFYKTKRLHMTLISAYYENSRNKNVYKRNAELVKMTSLNRLLERMLMLDPRHRLAIEFVCADPFIYEMFS